MVIDLNEWNKKAKGYHPRLENEKFIIKLLYLGKFSKDAWWGGGGLGLVGNVRCSLKS